jgi:hypothetical protein
MNPDKQSQNHENDSEFDCSNDDSQSGEQKAFPTFEVSENATPFSLQTSKKLKMTLKLNA